jgi:hypothetical protein
VNSLLFLLPCGLASSHCFLPGVIISRRQGRGVAVGARSPEAGSLSSTGPAKRALSGPLLASARNSVAESVHPPRFFSRRLLPRSRPRRRRCESGARGLGDLHSPGCLAGPLACSGPAVAARRPQSAEHRLSPSAASFRSRVRRAMSRVRCVPATWERRRVPAGVSRRVREVCSSLSTSKFGAFTYARRERTKRTGARLVALYESGPRRRRAQLARPNDRSVFGQRLRGRRVRNL